MPIRVAPSAEQSGAVETASSVCIISAVNCISRRFAVGPPSALSRLELDAAVELHHVKGVTQLIRHRFKRCPGDMAPVAVTGKPDNRGPGTGLPVGQSKT